MIRARVEPDLKAEAEQILSELGITATAAITIYYRQIVLQRRLPFDVLLPNAATRKALKQAAAGKNLLSASNADELFHLLGLRKNETQKERSPGAKTIVDEKVCEGHQEDSQER